MKKTVRILASTLAAAAIVGSAPAAASACDGSGPDGPRPFTASTHHHHHMTFAQRKAMILAGLTRADDRLSSSISRLSTAAQSDPNSWEAQALPRLQAKQSKLESVIAAVRAATSDRQIADAFRSAFGSSPHFHGWSRA